MTNARLKWLVPAMLALLAVRAWDLLLAPSEDTPQEAPALSEALKSPAGSSAAPPPAIVAAAATPAVAASEPIPDIFAPRRAPAPPTPSAPPVPPPPPPFVGPPEPPPPPPAPPPPALLVIGTWQDEAGASAFVSDSRAVAQAREGDVLFGQYRVTRLDADRLVVHDPVRRADFSYPVPRADPRMNPPPPP